jgi:divalent metal cation (Fe/Co/Zn/Cd) transporter
LGWRHGRRTAALIADGNHARADSYVSLAGASSAIVVALGLPIADPLIGLAITAVILMVASGTAGPNTRARLSQLK